MRRQSQKGFTLMEILIAMSIMTFITIYATQSVNRAVANRAKIQNDIDKNSSVRDALRIIARDIELAFHYRDMSIQVHNTAWRERIRLAEEEERRGAAPPPNPQNPPGAPPPGTPGTPPPPAPTGQTRSQQLREQYKPKQQLIFTHFIGEKDSIHLATLSHVRTEADSPDSDVAEVGYFLKDCTGRLNKANRSKCLWRRESTFLDDRVEIGGTESVILENVSKFELRYLGPNPQESRDAKPEWLQTWKTDPRLGADDRTRNRFPFAVEITLGIRNRKNRDDRELVMSRVAQLRFPNNPAQTAPGQTDPNNPQDPNALPGAGGLLPGQNPGFPGGQPGGGFGGP